jgi:hypothetical protein
LEAFILKIAFIALFLCVSLAAYGQDTGAAGPEAQPFAEREIEVSIIGSGAEGPLAGVLLRLPNGSTAATNATGQAVFAVPAGERVEVGIEYPGYAGRSLDIAPDSPYFFVVVLQADESVAELAEAEEEAEPLEPEAEPPAEREIEVSIIGSGAEGPLAGAALRLPDGSVVTTNSAGQAVFAVPAGERVEVGIEYPGYEGRSLAIAPDSPDIFVVAMRASAAELAEEGEPEEAPEAPEVTEAPPAYEEPEVAEAPPREAAKPVKPRRAPAWTPSEVPALSTGKRESRKYFEMGLLDLDLSGALGGMTIDGVMELMNSSSDVADTDSAEEGSSITNASNMPDLTAIENGLKVDLDLFTHPVYVKIPFKDVFTLDLFTGADVKAALGMPKDTAKTLKTIMSKLKDLKLDPPPASLYSSIPTSEAEVAERFEMAKAYQKTMQGVLEVIKEATSEDIDKGIEASASLFAEAGIGGSKTLLNDRLWIRAAPSVFFTILYMEQGSAGLDGDPGVSDPGKYGLKTTSSGLDMYSAWNLTDGPVAPFASPGFDLTLEAAYALFSMLDIGVAVSHIPIAPSTLRYKTSINVTGENAISFKTPDLREVETLVYRNVDTFTDAMDLVQEANDIDIEALSEDIELSYPENITDAFSTTDGESKKVKRPTRFDVYGIFKPFRTPILVLRPNVGATVHTVSNGDDPLFNWGLSIQFNAPKVFSASIGTGVTEGVFANRLGLAFDLRAFELDLGAGLTGTTYKESFSGNGLAAMVGIKFGW